MEAVNLHSIITVFPEVGVNFSTWECFFVSQLRCWDQYHVSLNLDCLCKENKSNVATACVHTAGRSASKGCKSLCVHSLDKLWVRTCVYASFEHNVCTALFAHIQVNTNTCKWDQAACVWAVLFPPTSSSSSQFTCCYVCVCVCVSSRCSWNSATPDSGQSLSPSLPTSLCAHIRHYDLAVALVNFKFCRFLCHSNFKTSVRPG